MGLQDLFNWQSKAAAQTTSGMPAVADEDLAADVDEPPDSRREKEYQPDFHKFAIQRPSSDRKISLLTAALKVPEVEPQHQPEIRVITDLARRRSMMSNASLASTAELTSDGGLTSPARTNTPSPPYPSNMYTSFAPYSLGNTRSMVVPALPTDATKESTAQLPVTVSVSPKSPAPVIVAPKRRCISFQCVGKDVPVTRPTPVVPQPAATAVPATEASKRACTLKFMCPGPRPSEKSTKVETTVPKTPQPSRVTENLRRNSSRSPSVTRKSPRPPLANTTRSHRDSTGTVRRASQSPLAYRKPKYIIADETTLQQSEATRFHEFASAELQEDDWIRKESDNPRSKLTINDTLKKENAIRQLGNEAEQEALDEDEEEEEEEEEDDGGNDSDDENGSDDDENDDSSDGSDEEASDGNETDNEAGFADSDEETDGDEDFSFWTPGRTMHARQSRDPITHRASAHRTSSLSSTESVGQLKRIEDEIRRPRRRAIKIRPGTPDLPDSTDFVCGTLDEDRPLEDAYVSCMEARKIAKHKRCPQDIDPSFPTSEPEDEEDEHDILSDNESGEEQVWLHGKFEDSGSERHGRRRSTVNRRKSPMPSPPPNKLRLRSPPPPHRRAHSPPPPTKIRLRSPPPRKLFGHSPRANRSPPPNRPTRSPRGSPTTQPIGFAPLGSRPGLTHTKSLPRTPNAFCRQYRASRLAAANGNGPENDNDGHVRGAIDIVKGLEHKRQRRKEKFYQKHVTRKHHKGERKPQPGKGAERMEQLGLLLSGKAGQRNPFMMSA